MKLVGRFGFRSRLSLMPLRSRRSDGAIRLTAATKSLSRLPGLRSTGRLSGVSFPNES
jgi:hypothetical protein